MFRAQLCSSVISLWEQPKLGSMWFGTLVPIGSLFPIKTAEIVTLAVLQLIIQYQLLSQIRPLPNVCTGRQHLQVLLSRTKLVLQKLLPLIVSLALNTSLSSNREVLRNHLRVLWVFAPGTLLSKGMMSLSQLVHCLSIPTNKKEKLPPMFFRLLLKALALVCNHSWILVILTSLDSKQVNHLCNLT